jgi:cell wall-associated NlpC family hydrolase
LPILQAMRMRALPGFGGLVATLLLAAGCAGTPLQPAPAGPPPEVRAAGGRIADFAISMVGVPYRYGGDHPGEGFDCSGLVYYTYASNGHAVPRTSRGQFGVAQKISLAQAAEGDLVFFRDQDNLSHVGIYLGDGRFVHAPSSGGAVTVASMDTAYYQRHFVAAGRLLP